MQLEVLNIEGQSTGRTVELPEEIFGVEPNEHVLYLAVKQHLAGLRQGTHKAKERGEITGSTRKIKRQKGTGTARAGSLKNPLFRGGGRVFGPKPRNYKQKLNKKVVALAKKSALAHKAQENAIKIIEDLKFDAPKTKQYATILNNLGLTGKRTLLVLGDDDQNLALSVRNIPKTEVASIKALHTYAILNNHTLILSESAVSSF